MNEPTPFGELPDGRPVTAYTLGGEGAPELRVLDVGATVQSLRPHDPRGGGVDGYGPNLVLGHREASAYVARPPAYHGAVVGRYANRIAQGRFSLDGVTHRLEPNEGATCLHGGPGGFHARLWTVKDLQPASITFQLVSQDGDQGFPGELTAWATYRVEPDTVVVELSASTTKPTVVNLTNHSYFNLSGEGSGSVDGHVLTVDADRYLPVDSTSIPIGAPAEVAGTPFDLTRGARIGEVVRAPHRDIGIVGGLDHSFDLRGEGLRRAARIEDPASGRSLEVHTDQPALQVYSGNFLDGVTVGSGGKRYRQGDGVALETQRHPDAPNQDWLPSPVLRPGETYRSLTLWRLGVSAGSP
ncbi:aldose epimerase family protein [Pedococcus sp. 5OH_020]|uniref:aldose epimerase family protein n=1 Tax=Pedococcus sp. 5OH_020 TaxID=2989814 RepID=UPI0022E9B489|nr:aldose epimerase family protein [Pedococcus sp. 5OH_020]